MERGENRWLLQTGYFRQRDDEWNLAQGVKKTGYCMQTVPRRVMMSGDSSRREENRGFCEQRLIAGRLSQEK